MSPITLRRKIRELRSSLGLSQAQLADRAGVGRMTIWRLEEAEPEPKRIDLDVLEAIARALGVHPAELLTYDPRPANAKRR